MALHSIGFLLTIPLVGRPHLGDPFPGFLPLDTNLFEACLGHIILARAYPGVFPLDDCYVCLRKKGWYTPCLSSAPVP